MEIKGTHDFNFCKDLYVFKKKKTNRFSGKILATSKFYPLSKYLLYTDGKQTADMQWVPINSRTSLAVCRCPCLSQLESQQHDLGNVI